MILIGLVGKKKAGKDTAYKMIHNALRHDYKVIRVAFADAIKKEVAFAAGVSLDFLENNKDNFRLILQGWGTDYRRKLFGDTYWITQWQTIIEFLESERGTDLVVVTTDCRFLNEAAVIRKYGGKLWKITMDNPSIEFMGEIDAHPSEVELEKIRCDLAIINHFNNFKSMQTEIEAGLLNLSLIK